jgi:hypothetical protein
MCFFYYNILMWSMYDLHFNLICAISWCCIKLCNFCVLNMNIHICHSKAMSHMFGYLKYWIHTDIVHINHIVMHTCNYILCTFNKGHSWCMPRFEYVKIIKTYSSTTLGLLQSHMVHQNTICAFIHLKSLKPFCFSPNMQGFHLFFCLSFMVGVPCHHGPIWWYYENLVHHHL